MIMYPDFQGVLSTIEMTTEWTCLEVGGHWVVSMREEFYWSVPKYLAMSPKQITLKGAPVTKGVHP